MLGRARSAARLRLQARQLLEPVNSRLRLQPWCQQHQQHQQLERPHQLLLQAWWSRGQQVRQLSTRKHVERHTRSASPLQSARQRRQQRHVRQPAAKRTNQQEIPESRAVPGSSTARKVDTKHWLIPEGDGAQSGKVSLPKPRFHSRAGGRTSRVTQGGATRKSAKRRSAPLPVHSHLRQDEPESSTASPLPPQHLGHNASRPGKSAADVAHETANAQASHDVKSITASRDAALKAKERAKSSSQGGRQGLLGRLNAASSAAASSTAATGSSGWRPARSRPERDENKLQSQEFMHLCEEVIASSQQQLFATASHNARSLYSAIQSRAALQDTPDHKRFLPQELTLLLETVKEMHAAVPGAIEEGNRISDGQLAAKVFPGVVSDFPLPILFEALMLVSWWGRAQELIFFMSDKVRPSAAAPPDYIQMLLTMHKLCCQIGHNLPTDKDAIPTALMLQDLLSVDALGSSPLLEKVYRRCMRLFVGQFDRYKDPSLLQHVIELFQQAKQNGVTPSPTMWMWVIHAHGKMGDLEGVNTVLETLQRNRLPPHTFVVGSILSMHCVNGDLARAEQILANMNHRMPWEPGANYKQPTMEWLLNKFQGFSATGIVEDPALYGPAAVGQNPDQTASASRRPRLSPGSLAPPPRGEPEGLYWPAPTSFMYNLVLHAYVSMNEIDKVHALYTDMKARGIRTDDGTANLIAEAFVDSPYGADLLRIEHPNLVPTDREFIDGRNLLRDGVLGPRVDGPTIFSDKLDLHKCSRAKAKIAVMAYFDAIANAQLEHERLFEQEQKRRNEKGIDDLLFTTPSEGVDRVFTIVTGKGQGDRRSGRKGPVLREFIRKVLEERDIPYWSPPGNIGRICVRVSDLKDIARDKQLQARNLEKTYRVSSSVAVVLLGLSTFSAIPFLISQL